MITGNNVLNMVCSFLKSIVDDSKPLGIYYRDIIVVATYLGTERKPDPVYEVVHCPVERIRGVGVYNCEAGKLIPKDCSYEILRNMGIIPVNTATFSSMHGGEVVTLEDYFYVIGVFWDDGLCNLGRMEFDDTTPVGATTPVIRIIHDKDNNRLQDKITRYGLDRIMTHHQEEFNNHLASINKPH